MTKGSYRSKPIDWDSFMAEQFTPHLFTEPVSGCGATALSLLTGVDPRCFRPSEHWPDKFMIDFLHKRGFRTQEITRSDVTREELAICAYVNRNHVILASQLVCKNVATWGVMHNKLWFHNFEVCNFRGLNLINNPIVTCYLVWHPSWRAERLPKVERWTR